MSILHRILTAMTELHIPIRRKIFQILTGNRKRLVIISSLLLIEHNQERVSRTEVEQETVGCIQRQPVSFTRFQIPHPTLSAFYNLVAEGNTGLMRIIAVCITEKEHLFFVITLITVLHQIRIRFFNRHIRCQSIVFLHTLIPTDKVFFRFMKQYETPVHLLHLFHPFLHFLIMLVMILQADRFMRISLYTENTPARGHKII